MFGSQAPVLDDACFGLLLSDTAALIRQHVSILHITSTKVSESELNLPIQNL